MYRYFNQKLSILYFKHFKINSKINLKFFSFIETLYQYNLFRQSHKNTKKQKQKHICTLNYCYLRLPELSILSQKKKKLDKINLYNII